LTQRPHAWLVATFFLIQGDPGHADAIAEFVVRLPGVVSAAVTSGPYDVVAEVSAAVARQPQLRAAVQQAPGLCRLCVCHGPPAVAATAGTSVS